MNGAIHYNEHDPVELSIAGQMLVHETEDYLKELSTTPSTWKYVGSCVMEALVKTGNLLLLRVPDLH
jgi:hypothetical protein